MFNRFEKRGAVSLTEITEIGDRSGTNLRSPSDPRVGSDGNIYVADTGYRDVRVFSPDGTLLHTMGGPGEGPGEFRRPARLSLGAQDSVFVYDRMLRRVSVFSPPPQPTFQYSFGLPSSAVRGATSVFAPQSESLFATYKRGVNQEDMKEGTWLTEISRQGEILRDSLAHLPATELIRAQRGEGRMQVIGKPFGRYPVFRPGPDGMPCYGWTGKLHIQCLNETGDVETLLDIPVRPKPVTDDDRDAYLRRVESTPNAAAMIENEGWHDTHPTYEIFTVSDEGHIWVKGLHDPTTPEGQEAPAWHVISPDSEWIRPVNLPKPDDRIFAVQDDRVFAYRVIPETNEVRLAVYQMDDA